MSQDYKDYKNTIDRMEPEIHLVDACAFYASASISLKRIADDTHRAADAIVEYLEWSKARYEEAKQQHRDAANDAWLRRKGLDDW